MRGFLYLSLLSGLAALSTWFLWAVQSTLRDDSDQSKNLPLLYMEHFTATRMNGQGVRQYNLTSPYLVQLPGEQGTLINTPHIITYEDDGHTPDWILDADRGRIAADNSVINLEENVFVNRARVSGKLPMNIASQDILVRPRENTIEGARQVRVESDQGVLEGMGFKVNLNTEQVELFSNVQGNFKPSR